MKLVTTIYDWLSRRTGDVTPRKKELKLFTTIYDDARLLGHFLAHYDRAGVTQFFIAVAEGHGSAVRPFMPPIGSLFAKSWGSQTNTRSE